MNEKDVVLKLESVAGEDDNSQIEILWKKQLTFISMWKESQIDAHDTDSDNEDDDNCVWLDKNKNRIKKIKKII